MLGRCPRIRKLSKMSGHSKIKQMFCFDLLMKGCCEPAVGVGRARMCNEKETCLS